MKRGRFITLEGGEGVGKSTQLAAIAQELRGRGLEVVVTREPGGSEGAEAIRELLLNGAADKWSARAEALLFAAARSDHLDKLIRPALERGAWVLCDRFIDSNRAYQSGASGLADADIMALHQFGSDALMPDRTLLFELPMEEAEARAKARDGNASDRFGARGAQFHLRVRDAFRQYAQADMARFRTISAAGTAPEVTVRAMAALSDLLP